MYLKIFFIRICITFYSKSRVRIGNRIEARAMIREEFQLIILYHYRVVARVKILGKLYKHFLKEREITWLNEK